MDLGFWFSFLTWSKVCLLTWFGSDGTILWVGIYLLQLWKLSLRTLNSLPEWSHCLMCGRGCLRWFQHILMSSLHPEVLLLNLGFEVLIPREVHSKPRVLKALIVYIWWHSWECLNRMESHLCHAWLSLTLYFLLLTCQSPMCSTSCLDRCTVLLHWSCNLDWVSIGEGLIQITECVICSLWDEGCCMRWRLFELSRRGLHMDWFEAASMIQCTGIWFNPWLVVIGVIGLD